MKTDPVTLDYRILECALEVHKALDPGLLESAYKKYLYYKLDTSGLQVEKEKPMPLVFEKVKLECGYRIDLLAGNKIVLELNAVEVLNDVHPAQVLACMCLGNYKLGLLMDFNVKALKQGIKRVIF